jgi:hypothetical protein
MRLRFLCSNHRDWLASNALATFDSWQRSYEHANNLLNKHDAIKAVNYAGCALEAAELLLFYHARQTKDDIGRFTDSALLLCTSLLRTGEPRLACGVIGGTIARLEELLFSGVERRAVLEGCQRLLHVGDHFDQPETTDQTRFSGQVADGLPRHSVH